MLKNIMMAAAVAVAMLSVPSVIAADSPKDMKCPTTTMNGKWVEATNVTDDCVPKSLF